LDGNHLFKAKSSGELICVDAATGEQVWRSTTGTDLKNGASIHLVPNGDSALLYTDKGVLIRARLTTQSPDMIREPDRHFQRIRGNTGARISRPGCRAVASES
jgi:outer membrane protein assembly factor BamB